MADVVEHLLEMERRETALDRGYPSLFTYCVKKLGYSEGAAFLRIRAARAAGEFPDVLDRLRMGRLHLDGIARLYPHLTGDNAAALLDRADGASKREVVALVATLQPEPAPGRDVIVPVPASAAMPGAQAAPSEPPTDPLVIPPPSHRFHFTGDAELLAMVERLRGLLRHKHPDGRLENIFKEAVQHLLSALEASRLPSKRDMRSQAGAVPIERRTGSRVVPRRVKKQVWLRDGGRCAFLAPDGRRCESREALEYDHIMPWADGGRSDETQNIRLLCRAHNQRLGRRRFGLRRRLC